MCAAAYLRQRPLLRDLLLGGRLAEQGLLDAAVIEAYLARDLAEGDFDYFRLIEIGDIERWVRAVEAGASRDPSFAQRRY
jgi:asparagine synthase (glutamine-hydrolysing)